jgi:hypothetical protein
VRVGLSSRFPSISGPWTSAGASSSPARPAGPRRSRSGARSRGGR